VYVGNVDYGSTAEELEHHFSGCGQVNRVTILCNKFDGSPKGFAYIEFLEKRAIFEAMMMDQTLFRGRTLKVGFLFALIILFYSQALPVRTKPVDSSSLFTLSLVVI
jgi:RNA recognition motif-containing protein